MILFVTSLIALISYGLGTFRQSQVYLGRAEQHPFFTLTVGLAAATLHFAANLLMLDIRQGFSLDLLDSMSFITNLIVAVLLFLSRRKPVQNLLLVGYPLAMITLLLALFLEPPSHRVQQAQAGILLHASLSIVAYSIFSVAALQALLLFIQNKQLKTHISSRLIKALPPLQTMESMLFETIWAGMLLLTLSILTGALFFEDLFAQHLVHKTAFSLIAWVIFSILLLGRHIYGWRGPTASRWTLGGTIILMLGYLGSKLVLELILQR